MTETINYILEINDCVCVCVGLKVFLELILKENLIFLSVSYLSVNFMYSGTCPCGHLSALFKWDDFCFSHFLSFIHKMTSVSGTFFFFPKGVSIRQVPLCCIFVVLSTLFIGYQITLQFNN